MRWYLKVIITVAVLVALQLVTLQAQEPVTRLRWKNAAGHRRTFRIT